MLVNRLRRIFKGMKQRCYNSNNKAYKNYGGREIKICDEWLNDIERFVNWAYSNGYKPGLTIERINNDGNYEPDNCRWATPLEQADNRRTTIHVIIDGEKVNLRTLARELGIHHATIDKRYREGKRGIDLIRNPDRKSRRNSWDMDISIEDDVHTLIEWSKLTGIDYGTLRTRYKKGDRGKKLIRPVKR